MIEHVKCNTFWNYSSRDTLYEALTLEEIWEAWSGEINVCAVSERVYQFLFVRLSQQTVMWNLLGWNDFSLSLKSVVLAPRDTDNITIPQWQ